MTTRLALIAFCGLFAASSLFGVNPKDDANARDLKNLQGKWVGEWLVVDGKKTRFTDNKLSVSVVFKGDSIMVEENRGGRITKETGQVTLDATRTPRTMDITARHGDDNGITVRALYAFENDMLKLCTAQPDAERPKEFKASKENGHMLMFFKRSK